MYAVHIRKLKKYIVRNYTWGFTISYIRWLKIRKLEKYRFKYMYFLNIFRAILTRSFQIDFVEVMNALVMYVTAWMLEQYIVS